MELWLFLTFLILKSFSSQCCEWVNAVTIRKAIGSKNRFLDCFLGYKFTIPAGAFVDVDSWKELHTHTYVETVFDVEMPMEKSRDAPLYVCPKRRLRKNFVFNDSFEIPLHLRYHAATGQEAEVSILAPQLLLRCMENSTFLTVPCRKYLFKAPCDCSTESFCQWLMIPFLEHSSVKFKIPTGNKASLRFILIITIFVVLCCALTIVLSSISKITKTKME
ncbi:unnamed protein product [Thelazia callipaeda]|uniref:Phosphatidylinositol-glycan biosynthesis class X protein n=1 Tax=Thelazia callipaeda TaxID=103827 RepID=A0A0N5CYC9_THECL|nr:unnamed protein product [Thelazia callipaeda]